MELEVPVNVFETLLLLFTAVSGSLGIGSGIAFFIQLGKLWWPKVFANETAQNIRMAVSLVIAVVLYAAPHLGWDRLGIDYVDSLLSSLAALGIALFPLFVWLTDLFSKKFYATFLRGAAYVGRSYTLDTKLAGTASPDPSKVVNKPV